MTDWKCINCNDTKNQNGVLSQKEGTFDFYYFCDICAKKLPMELDDNICLSSKIAPNAKNY